MSMLRLSLRVPASMKAPRDARHALQSLELSLGRELRETVELLVSELVSNAVRHANLDDSDLIEVSVNASHDRVRVEVQDPGGLLDPSKIDLGKPAVARWINLDSEEDAGWGLYILDRLVKRWGVSSDGHTMVWFELHVQQS